jgi:hypothetical protein
VLLDGLRRFGASAHKIAGVRRIAVLGSIGALTCFSPTSGAHTSGGRVVGRTAGLECDGRAMRFIAVDGHISTTISMRFA